jgi:hypothetical protein
MARAVLLVLVAVFAAGCGSHHATMTVRERFERVQDPHRVSGTTMRAGQVVRNDCAIGAVYTVREATGTAYLSQNEIVHLRLHAPRAGTAYELECLGPLVVELPAKATRVRATVAHESVPVRTHVSVRPLRPAPGKQIVVFDWPRRTSAGLELSFELPKARLIRERVVYTASITCGGSSYLEPLVPLSEGLGFVNAYTVPPHGRPFDFILPRIAPGISSHIEQTANLRCGP